ncbi:DUF3368 domain-containing protein [Candidatus Poribacteria bacterium]|nr:DUF3368 domain-containing protein [Candidatus Poribacteria bacterium]
MNRRITDASPLLFLAKLERLELLLLGVEQVLVPSAALHEVRAKHDEAAARVERVLMVWLAECPVTRPELIELLYDLGAGEREVVAQARQEGVVSVAMDDLAARRTARRVGLEPIGTVGLLLAARKRRLIPSLRDELDALAQLGFRASGALVAAALREAGEI